MKRLKRSLVALTAVGATFFIFAGVASANTGQPVMAYSKMQTSVTDKSVAVASINGAIQVRWEFPNGWKPSKAVKQDCKWVTGGTNSYIRADGKRMWVDWTGKRAYICPSKTSSTGWRKAGGPPTWENCGNEFAPVGHPHPPVFKGKYKVVKVFTYTAKVSVRAVVSASGSVYASCEAYGAKAWASASASGYGMAMASASASGRTRLQAGNLATSTAVSMFVENDLRLKAEADVKVNISLAAQANCTGAPPPPPVTPPCADCPKPPPPPPPTCPPNTNGTPPNCVPGKDGTPGPGENTPGPGNGGGSGGEPVEKCKDRVTGEIRPGKPSPVDGGCLDQGTGTPPPPPPPPPAPGRCTDPDTEQERDMRSDETKDAMGYCMKKSASSYLRYV